MKSPRPIQRANAGVQRVYFPLVLLLVLLGAVEWRLVHLQVLRHDELEAKAEDYEFTTRTEQSWRGQIQDARGRPLALTVPVKNIYADLSVWTNRVELLASVVAPLLDTNAAGLALRVRQALLAKKPTASESADPGSNLDPAAAEISPGALLLKRGVEPAKWDSIQDALARANFGLPTNRLASRQRALLKGLRRWTLFALDDQRRYYPYGESLSQVLGFVGSSTNGHLLQGKWGLEATLDAVLAGQNGVCASSQDAAGNELAFCRTRELDVRDGSQVVLTVDMTLQQIVEQALAKTLARYHPTNASCVVVRPATGEILALASLPAFSPGQPGASPPAAWRDHVISDRNEVGSVFKVITLAAALDRGVVNLEEPIFCENGHWIYQKSALRDDDHHYGYLSVRDCLAKSSNIGFAKIGLRVGAKALYDAIVRFGFDRCTGLPLPYETAGFLRPVADWKPASITRVAIGHELAVSQLQLAMAYAAIANDGVLLRPMLVKQLNHADGSLWGRYAAQPIRRVVKPETARLVREAMRSVVEHGTGQQAALPGYSVAGKTGTAQISDGHRFLPGHNYCSFVGLVPADKPELVIAVAVDDPGNNTYGGTVAAPVFREIAEQAVALFGIPPDAKPSRPQPLVFTRNAHPAPGLIASVH
jgi:cell division protein FtsI/penicillin-binding protein 2